MTKKELIEILKKKASASYAISKDYEGQNEKMSYGLKKEAWTLQSVIDMLEDKKLYEEMKSIWLKEGK